jgi:hypothetical protein
MALVNIEFPSTDVRTRSSLRSPAARASDGVIAEYVRTLAAAPMRRELPAVAPGVRTQSTVRPLLPVAACRPPADADSRSQRWTKALIANASGATATA